MPEEDCCQMVNEYCHFLSSLALWHFFFLAWLLESYLPTNNRITQVTWLLIAERAGDNLTVQAVSFSVWPTFLVLTPEVSTQRR